MSATRRDLVRRLAERLDESQRETHRRLGAFFDVLVETIAQEQRVELRGFGAFEVRIIKEQATVDPRTGEPIIIPETLTVDFKPGKDLREAIRGGSDE